MVKRYNRLLVAIHVIADVISSAASFVLAAWLRFDSPFVRLVPVTRGAPLFSEYAAVVPIVAAIVPLAFQLQGLYRLRRGRTRVDDFFAVLVGNILAVLAGIVGTLFLQAYYPEGIVRDPISRAVWILFLGLNVILTFSSRELVRDLLRRRWRAGIGLKRVLIVGASDLGRMVADRILEHSELGFRLLGFVDDRLGVADMVGHRGLPLLGTVQDTAEVCLREKVDVVYVALPVEEHVKTLAVVEFASRECVDVHVVPDLLQFIALRARLEDLDGLPIISINDVPLRGLNSVIKRVVDVALSSAALSVGCIPALILAGLVKRSSPGPVFYRQERMGLDGKAFTVFKFRSMPVGAEDHTGPIWSPDNDPRVTAVGRWLRRHDIDELPQFWNVLKGDMSIVGPRPERPFFVEQFKHRIPQYMLRHKVKAGITGWAQVNGWRGNTSLEKRIEFDLYYIENWSLSLDIKIMWLTVLRGLHRMA
jgi:Undecaprenyl-phosphate glucose phosphotransferase